MKNYLGVDVGTGSARAGLFDGAGYLLGAGTVEIETFRPAPDFAQQSSADIWRAVMSRVHEGDAPRPLPLPGDLGGTGAGFEPFPSSENSGAQGGRPKSTPGIIESLLKDILGGGGNTGTGSSGNGPTGGDR